VRARWLVTWVVGPAGAAAADFDPGRGSRGPSRIGAGAYGKRFDHYRSMRKGESTDLSWPSPPTLTADDLATDLAHQVTGEI
jgi:hypothetical protein